MMTLEAFINEWNGKYIDYDGMYGFQCVDLIRKYVDEALGKPPYVAIPYTGDAKNIFNNFKENQYFTKIYNTPTNIPSKGDILFWGYPYGFYFDGLIPKWAGHTAICSNAWLMGLISFDQRWGNPNFCKYVNHSYTGMLGWLHKK